METSHGQSLTAALAAAVSDYWAGKLDRTETLYKQIPEVHPDHSQTLYLLGLLSR